MSHGIRMYDGTYAEFLTWSMKFADHFSAYQQKDGKLAFGHVLAAVHAEGFTEINRENIETVKAALIARAKRKAA